MAVARVDVVHVAVANCLSSGRRTPQHYNYWWSNEISGGEREGLLTCCGSAKNYLDTTLHRQVPGIAQLTADGLMATRSQPMAWAQSSSSSKLWLHEVTLRTCADVKETASLPRPSLVPRLLPQLFVAYSMRQKLGRSLGTRLP